MLLLRTFFATATLAFATTNALEHISPHQKAARSEVTIIPGVLHLDPNILSAGNQLINLNVLAGLLGPTNCTSVTNAVVGVKLSLSLFPLLSVCACVNVGGTLPIGTASCPSCPANASPACLSATCACTCNAGYYAYTDTATGKQMCAPATECVSPNVVVQLSNGRSSCVCGKNFIDNLLGGCINACVTV
ncbi:hypothetical protein RQP46_003369 [Phenoliferia psychrophenolica]